MNHLLQSGEATSVLLKKIGERIGETNKKMQEHKYFIDCYIDFICFWLWEDSVVFQIVFCAKKPGRSMS